MVEGIEQIRAKDEPDSFFNAEGTAHRKISLHQIKSTEGVTSKISLYRASGHNEGTRIQPPSSAHVGIVNPLRGACDQIRAERKAPETNVACERDVDGQAGL